MGGLHTAVAHKRVEGKEGAAQWAQYNPWFPYVPSMKASTPGNNLFPMKTTDKCGYVDGPIALHFMFCKRLLPTTVVRQGQTQTLPPK